MAGNRIVGTFDGSTFKLDGNKVTKSKFRSTMGITATRMEQRVAQGAKKATGTVPGKGAKVTTALASPDK